MPSQRRLCALVGLVSLLVCLTHTDASQFFHPVGMSFGIRKPSPHWITSYLQPSTDKLDKRAEIGFSTGIVVKKPQRTRYTATTARPTTKQPTRGMFYLPYFFLPHRTKTTTTTTTTAAPSTAKPPYVPYYPWNWWYRPVHRRRTDRVRSPTPSKPTAQKTTYKAIHVPKRTIWRPLYQIRHNTVYRPSENTYVSTKRPQTTTHRPQQYYVPLFKQNAPKRQPTYTTTPRPTPAPLKSTFYEVQVQH